MLRHKKQKHQDAQIQELIKTNDPVQFWSTLKTVSKSNSTTADSNVPIDELFTNTSNNYTQLQERKPFPNPRRLLWKA